MKPTLFLFGLCLTATWTSMQTSNTTSGAPPTLQGPTSNSSAATAETWIKTGTPAMTSHSTDVTTKMTNGFVSMAPRIASDGPNGTVIVPRDLVSAMSNNMTISTPPMSLSLPRVIGTQSNNISESSQTLATPCNLIGDWWVWKQNSITLNNTGPTRIVQVRVNATCDRHGPGNSGFNQTICPLVGFPDYSKATSNYSSIVIQNLAWSQDCIEHLQNLTGLQQWCPGYNITTLDARTECPHNITIHNTGICQEVMSVCLRGNGTKSEDTYTYLNDTRTCCHAFVNNTAADPRDYLFNFPGCLKSKISPTHRTVFLRPTERKEAIYRKQRALLATSLLASLKK
ncbi:uncharacterized protein LOC132831377 [Hemiscyllium ocellatum]|uniref:uncharacterized protein LOC132831377 n=1 Tax=Hemiscyllium ocellatum TaxID=170820 RepID=UPI0029673C7D|nr:uncharacterized protein LOC132831377 [Hemiscyllium ocellatum]XP_060705474.1 uncharacterized protein LOC132831377 [Hemiscyllium ocellatum]